MINPINSTAALIIDIENLIGGLIINQQDSVGIDAIKFNKNFTFDIGLVCDAIIEMHGALNFRKSIGDLYYSCKRTNYMELNFPIKKNFHDNFIDIHEVTNFDNVKDNTDFVIYTETLDLAYREKSIDSFAIFSMDKGFIPLYIKLKQLGKKVTVVCISENHAPASISRIVDNVIYYNNLVPNGKNLDAAAPVKEQRQGSKTITLISPSSERYEDQLSVNGYTSSSHTGNKESKDDLMYDPLVPTSDEGEGSLSKLEPPESELPAFVNSENFLLADKIVKCVEYKLRSPVLSRDQYNVICQMIDREFNSVTKDGNSVFMVDLSSEITKLILNGKDIITGSDLKIYNTDNRTIDSLVDRVVYKVLRTLHVVNVFKKVPNENYKTNNFTLSSYAEDEPNLLAHLFYGFFNILGSNNIPLVAGALTMAFHNYPTQEALDEMTQFIRQYEQIMENNRKYRTSRIYSNNPVSRPNSLSVLGYNKH